MSITTIMIVSIASVFLACIAGAYSGTMLADWQIRKRMKKEGRLPS